MRERPSVCCDCGSATTRSDTYRCRPCHFARARAAQDARRQQVPALVAAGLTRHQIAARLECSVDVIRDDVRALGLHCPTGAPAARRERVSITEFELNRRALMTDLAGLGWPPGAVGRCKATGRFYSGRGPDGALILLPQERGQ